MDNRNNNNTSDERKGFSVKDKPKSKKLLELLIKAKVVYAQIEGIGGLKNKKKESGQHFKDFEIAIERGVQLLEKTGLDDYTTVQYMLSHIYSACIDPTKSKYENTVLFRNKKLLDHLIDPKHANDHHFIRLIFVVLDAVKQAKLDVDPKSTDAEQHKVDQFQQWVVCVWPNAYTVTTCFD